MKADLSSPPKRLRSRPAKGKGLSAALKIEREGGDHGAGIIRGFSVITKGEALGHGFWIDETMLGQVAAGINAASAGIKSRFTHPGLSADGLGRHLGRVKNASVVEGSVVADLHFSKTAQATPDGNLAEYCMDLAEEDPSAFGASIVFYEDEDAQDAFEEEHGGEDFASPDPDNKANHQHVRLGKLCAADLVDEPAANPRGLFHRGDEIAAEASEFAAYALGLEGAKRPPAAFGVDPDRAAKFFERFLDERGLKVVKASDVPAPAAPPKGQDFLDEFGAQGGVWFAQGLSLDAARREHVKSQSERIAALETELKNVKAAAEALRGTKPVEFSPPPDEQRSKPVPPLIRRVGAASIN